MFHKWRTLPQDMTTLMRHVVISLMVIHSLRAHTHSRLSPQPDDILSDSHHNSPSAHALGE